MQYRNIICPLCSEEDLNNRMEEAAEYLGKITDARLILVNVVEKWYRAQPMVTNSEEWDAIHEQWLDEGRQILEKEALKLRDRGVKHIETVLREGDAAYEIIATANERKADLIIMTTHRYSPLGKVFYGSVTERVAKKAPCPIMWIFK